jgi:copper chaperone NosL
MTTPLLQTTNRFLARTLNLRSRALLVVGAVALAGSFLFPLWQISLVAPQYPDGLDLYIYAHQLESGGEGQDLVEINILNHYIGMMPIDEADFVEMQVIPFAIGFLILLTLRAVVFGKMGNVVDVLALFAYFSLFSLVSFYYQLHTYGTDLDPRAPMTIEPFVPRLVGTQQIANFEQSSLPHAGSLLMVVFALCLVAAIFLSRNEDPALEAVT